MPLAAAARAQERRNGATPAANSSFYWQFAQTTRTFTDGALMTRWGSYRNASGETATLAWNDASQIYAEAAMVPAEDSAEAHVAATFNFMKNFSASGNAITGYCPSAAIDGGKLDRSIQHVDDNAFAAIAYLEAAEAVTSRDSAALAAAADLLAFWLLHSDLSDPIFGGGFWRTTARPFKPTHANGLALQLFLRLYLGSGKREHLDKAHMTYDWLRGTLLDRDGLYAWKISSSGLDRTKFAYDQAIMIEAELLMHRATQHLTHATHLKRAQSLAMALKATLWDPIFGGFLLNSNEPMRSPMFCGWVSQSLIRLYETDRNAAWLDHAQANIDVLNLFLRNPADGGYYSMCKVDGSERSPLRQCADQSWMQRTQALLSRHRGTVEGK
ncbi:MAG TPA: glycoside hydrolase family 76 protein [Xanthobacteraceae bacterium]|nr:glycoside hydrolase family 76 protein [Xanthobacteraceae bacterium]